MSPAARRGRPPGPAASSARRKPGVGSLTVVGTGIQLIGHATLQAVRCMERAGKLIYLVANPAAEAWVRSLNPTAESLADCYGEGKPRSDSYAQMVERILGAVRAGQDVCAAFYGHPGVFVRPSHEAIRRARLEGFAARMLPGISAEDCLFADLGVDPADEGCQSFEASHFLARRPRFDPSSGLILWQIAAVGQQSVVPSAATRRRGVNALARLLARHYPRSHDVIVYEAAQLPVCDPIVVRVPLSRLGSVEVSTLATLYVPPIGRRRTGPRASGAASPHRGVRRQE
jgi:uncharacterized protein YabN with tetrapyrrole methylase and pyrophosphatase domain